MTHESASPIDGQGLDVLEARLREDLEFLCYPGKDWVPAREGVTDVVIIGGGKRGVVSTACYVARIRGVRSAMPMFQALKLCPDAVVLKPRMALYADVSRRIRAMMEDLTRAAARLVTAGQITALDVGTTTFELGKLLVAEALLKRIRNQKLRF